MRNAVHTGVLNVDSDEFRVPGNYSIGRIQTRRFVIFIACGIFVGEPSWSSRTNVITIVRWFSKNAFFFSNFCNLSGLYEPGITHVVLFTHVTFNCIINRNQNCLTPDVARRFAVGCIQGVRGDKTQWLTAAKKTTSSYGTGACAMIRVLEGKFTSS